jgi:glycosyltransferase involved in cell wall biosynthesis
MQKTNNLTNATDFLGKKDLVCFSHLRWGFVYQRPQHLLSRFAKQTRVFFIEEPIFYDGPSRIEIKQEDNLYNCVPHIPHGTEGENLLNVQRQLVSDVLSMFEIKDFVSWYYTPMALQFSDHLTPDLIVYDCMDELSAFKFAPPILKQLEKQMFSKADVVFTGGHSIYEAKKTWHPNIHPMPSSIDKEHFAQARTITEQPADQANIPHPRLGFYGVIDERFDIELLREAANKKPDWHFVILGPVVKIDEADLPRNENIHYLGSKNYKELPHYLAGWDIALIPFAMNESTRFISPTKTPEYLAAGKPVISTPIKDVVNPYGTNNLVHIVHTAEAFVAAGEEELSNTNKKKWLFKSDKFLADQSWDKTWSDMVDIMNRQLTTKAINNTAVKTKIYV